MTKKLLVASTNSGKIKEIKKIYENLNINIKGLKDFSDIPEIKEDGETFRDNALKKARTASARTNLLTMADDSGLVVEYLEGGPGVYSARYAGLEATDKENNEKLMEEMDGVSWDKRKAYFKCVMALVDPLNEKSYTVEGICRGYIATHPRGENGFGYDPLFYVPQYKKTMAELSSTVKNEISHRAEALLKMKNILKDIL